MFSIPPGEMPNLKYRYQVNITSNRKNSQHMSSVCSDSSNLKRTLTHQQWVMISKEHSVRALVCYLSLWYLLNEVILQQGIMYSHVWKLLTSGQYRTKSIYEALFEGGTKLGLAKRILNHGLPTNAILYLVSGTNAGPLTVWLVMGCQIQLDAPFAIRKNRRSTICSFHVSRQFWFILDMY
jgi:hypothetical protein